MFEIFDLRGRHIATVDLETARRKYGSVQYGWRKVGSQAQPQ